MKIFVMIAAVLAASTSMALAQDASTPNDADALFASTSVLTQQTGEGIYNAVCAGCHMPDGEGAVGAGAYPALADNPNLEFPEYAIYLTIHGQAGMPALGGIMDDQQIASVIEYIRTSFGNDYSEPVTAETVAASR